MERHPVRADETSANLIAGLSPLLAHYFHHKAESSDKPRDAAIKPGYVQNPK